MRYLYGDSHPFPLQYDFLRTLEGFVGAAVKTVSLHTELEKLQASTGESFAVRLKTMQDLETFHSEVAGTIRAFAKRSASPLTADYARQVEELATRIIEEARRSSAQATEREQAELQGHVDKKRADIKDALGQFLVSSRLPVVDWKLSMRLHDAKNELTAIFQNPEGISTSFTLATASLPSWQGPRRITDFAHGIDLQIGVKKSWITRTVQPEVVHVDDFYLGGLELSDDDAEIRLRRKPDMKDSLGFHLRREDTELHADVQRLEEEGAPSSPLDAADRAQLERLWQLLRSNVLDCLGHKQRLIFVKLDGDNVFETDRSLVLIKRLVTLFAPIVKEIDRRSPSPAELSLKQEDPKGRREELYLRKDALVAAMAPLTGPQKAVFEPLGLNRRGPEFLSDVDVALDD